jgi:hypothetical protein
MTTIAAYQKLASPPESKPQPGVGINWSHQFAQGLIAAVPYNDPVANPDDFCVKDYVTGLVSRYQKGANDNPTWINSGTVKGLSGPDPTLRSATSGWLYTPTSCASVAINGTSGHSCANLQSIDGCTIVSWLVPKAFSNGINDSGTIYLGQIAGLGHLDLIVTVGGALNWNIVLEANIADRTSSLRTYSCHLGSGSGLTDLYAHWVFKCYMWACSIRFAGTFTDNDQGPVGGVCRFYNQWGPIRDTSNGNYDITTNQYGLNYALGSSGNPEFQNAYDASFPGNCSTAYALLAYNYPMGDEALKELMVNPLQMFCPIACGGALGSGWPFVIIPVIPHDPPTVTLTATPNSGRASDLCVLAWTSTGADTLVLDNGIGSVTVPNGSTAVYPLVTTTYTITATNDSGTATATATFTVTSVRRTVPGILQRDLTKTTDIGLDGSATSFTAYATIGNIVLAQPSELALLLHITTDSLAIGTKPGVSVLLDEIAPTIAVPFTALAVDCHDPAVLVQATNPTLFADRYYISESRKPAACRHLQVKISWPAEAAANELLTWSIIGASVEDR